MVIPSSTGDHIVTAVSVVGVWTRERQMTFTSIHINEGTYTMPVALVFKTSARFNIESNFVTPGLIVNLANIRVLQTHLPRCFKKRNRFAIWFNNLTVPLVSHTEAFGTTLGRFVEMLFGRLFGRLFGGFVCGLVGGLIRRLLRRLGARLGCRLGARLGRRLGARLGRRLGAGLGRRLRAKLGSRLAASQ